MGSSLSGCWVSAAVLKGEQQDWDFTVVCFGKEGEIVPMSHNPRRDVYRVPAVSTGVRLIYVVLLTFSFC